jgi:DNA-binding MarR family transcriptional regulator
MDGLFMLHTKTLRWNYSMRLTFLVRYLRYTAIVSFNSDHLRGFAKLWSDQGHARPDSDPRAITGSILGHPLSSQHSSRNALLYMKSKSLFKIVNVPVKAQSPNVIDNILILTCRSGKLKPQGQDTDERESDMDIFRDLFLMQQTYATLFSVTNKLQVKGDQYIGELTSRQMMVMVAIVHLPEDETTIINIARKLGTTKQSVKQLITILEKKGFTVSVPSRQDGRAVNIKITEAGRNASILSAERSFRFFADVFDRFTTQEMETLWVLLKKLYRFDGEEQDGFEEAVDYGAEDGFTPSQQEAIDEFKRRRMQADHRETI